MTRPIPPNLPKPSAEEQERCAAWRKYEFEMDRFEEAVRIAQEARNCKGPMLFRGVAVDESWPADALVGLVHFAFANASSVDFTL